MMNTSVVAILLVSFLLLVAGTTVVAFGPLLMVPRNAPPTSSVAIIPHHHRHYSHHYSCRLQAASGNKQQETKDDSSSERRSSSSGSNNNSKRQNPHRHPIVSDFAKYQSIMEARRSGGLLLPRQQRQQQQTRIASSSLSPTTDDDVDGKPRNDDADAKRDESSVSSSSDDSNEREQLSAPETKGIRGTPQRMRYSVDQEVLLPTSSSSIGWSRAMTSRQTMSAHQLLLFLTEQYVLLVKGKLGYARRVMMNRTFTFTALSSGGGSSWQDHVEDKLHITPQLKQDIVNMPGTPADIVSFLLARRYTEEMEERQLSSGTVAKTDVSSKSSTTVAVPIEPTLDPSPPRPGHDTVQHPDPIAETATKRVSDSKINVEKVTDAVPKAEEPFQTEPPVSNVSKKQNVTASSTAPSNVETTPTTESRGNNVQSQTLPLEQKTPPRNAKNRTSNVDTMFFARDAIRVNESSREQQIAKPTLNAEEKTSKTDTLDMTSSKANVVLSEANSTNAKDSDSLKKKTGPKTALKAEKSVAKAKNLNKTTLNTNAISSKANNTTSKVKTMSAGDTRAVHDSTRREKMAKTAMKVGETLKTPPSSDVPPEPNVSASKATVNVETTAKTTSKATAATSEASTQLVSDSSRKQKVAKAAPPKEEQSLLSQPVSDAQPKQKNVNSTTVTSSTVETTVKETSNANITTSKADPVVVDASLSKKQKVAKASMAEKEPLEARQVSDVPRKQKETASTVHVRPASSKAKQSPATVSTASPIPSAVKEATSNDSVRSSSSKDEVIKAVKTPTVNDVPPPKQEATSSKVNTMSAPSAVETTTKAAPKANDTASKVGTSTMVADEARRRGDSSRKQKVTKTAPKSVSSKLNATLASKVERRTPTTAPVANVVTSNATNTMSKVDTIIASDLGPVTCSKKDRAARTRLEGGQPRTAPPISFVPPKQNMTPSKVNATSEMKAEPPTKTSEGYVLQSRTPLSEKVVPSTTNNSKVNATIANDALLGSDSSRRDEVANVSLKVEQPSKAKPIRDVKPKEKSTTSKVNAATSKLELHTTPKMGTKANVLSKSRSKLSKAKNSSSKVETVVVDDMLSVRGASNKEKAVKVALEADASRTARPVKDRSPKRNVTVGKVDATTASKVETTSLSRSVTDSQAPKSKAESAQPKTWETGASPLEAASTAYVRSSSE